MDAKRRAELEKILLTTDGKGRRVKEEALAELLTNAQQDGYERGCDDATYLIDMTKDVD